jgi:hypothetical protein
MKLSILHRGRRGRQEQAIQEASLHHGTPLLRCTEESYKFMLASIEDKSSRNLRR